MNRGSLGRIAATATTERNVFPALLVLGCLRADTPIASEGVCGPAHGCRGEPYRRALNPAAHLASVLDSRDRGSGPMK